VALSMVVLLHHSETWCLFQQETFKLIQH
jgi:hypothetical protein